MAAPAVEVLWEAVTETSVGTGVRASPERSPVVTAWTGAGPGAGALALPLTNSLKLLQFLLVGLVVEPLDGALGDIAAGLGAVGFLGKD